MEATKHNYLHERVSAKTNKNPTCTRCINKTGKKHVELLRIAERLQGQCVFGRQ